MYFINIIILLKICGIKLYNSTEKKQRSARVLPAQKDALISYMEIHSMFAAGRFCGPQGKVGQQQQWERLAKQLNTCGPQKSAKQWQTVIT